MFDGTDACVAPVLSFAEVPDHPHIAARRTIVTLGGVPQAAPAPRFSRTTPDLPTLPPQPGADPAAILADWDIGGSSRTTNQRERDQR
jgi:alpha-methylacyl-CoA racemase